MKRFFKILAVITSLFATIPAVANDAASQSYIFNITYENAQDAIGKAISDKLAEEKGENVAVTAIINGRKPAPLYSSNRPVEVEVRGLRPDSSLNRWSASMVILEGENVISAMPLSGRYMVMSEVPVLKRPLRYGEVISELDIEMKSFPKERTSSDTVISSADLIGRTPMRSVSPNRPIRSSEISAPAVVKKNALVQMRYRTPSMEITTSGQALGDGAKGDVIEVRNISSKKTVHAVVSENNIVDVVGQGTETSQIIQQNNTVSQ